MQDFIVQLNQALTSFNWHEFHLQRPLWLTALVPLLILAALLYRRRQQAHNWVQAIDPELLTHLIEGSTSKAQKGSVIALAAAWVISSVALAGPSWQKLPEAVHKLESARIFLLDLSPSMLAEDIKPNRLVRARLKLIDLLHARPDGLQALIAYAGEAHTVTPLTDDIATITSQLEALSPQMMPVRGSNTEMAVARALKLFADAGIKRGEIVLITDGVEPMARDELRKQLGSTAFNLNILAVGTDQGAPIPTGRGGFARDSMGAIVIAKPEASELRQLAAELGGRFSRLRSDNRDVETLNQLPADLDQQTRKVERQFDNWRDFGQWLVLLLLPLSLYSFRRGVILPALILAPLLLGAPQRAAADWQDLWLTPDQQAQRAMARGDYAAAAKAFTDAEHRAAAEYRAGNYQQAADAYQQLDSAPAHYNRGNALAKAGKLQQALEAYEQALKLQPDFEDAIFNRDLVKKLLEQQQNQSEQNQQNPPSDSSDKNSDNSSSDSASSQSGDTNSTDNSSQNGDAKPNSSDNSKPQAGDESSESGEQGDQQQMPDLNSADSSEGKTENNNADTPPADQSDSQNADEGSQDNSEAEAQTQVSGSDDKSQNANKQARTGVAKPAEAGQLDPETEQWLRGIADDPAGLLKNKFEYQSEQRRREAARGQWQAPENGATDRW